MRYRRFRCRLPAPGIDGRTGATGPSVPAPAIAHVTLVGNETPSALRRVRVVVVDDIEDTTRNIAKLIGFESDMEVVGMAFDGMEGLAVTRATKPDIVLMDIHMPVMDGITAAETIGEGRDFEGAIIMMSVEGGQDYMRRSMLAGALEYLVKPFSADELIDAIRNTDQIMEKRRAQLALHHQLTAEVGSR